MDARPAGRTKLQVLSGHTGSTVFDLDHRPVLWPSPEAHAAQTHRPSRSLVIAERGERGTAVYDSSGMAEAPGIEVDAVNGLGAGDAFAAAVGYGLRRGLDPVEAARLEDVGGALVTQAIPCSEAMPAVHEISEFLRTADP